MAEWCWQHWRCGRIRKGNASDCEMISTSFYTCFLSSTPPSKDVVHISTGVQSANLISKPGFKTPLPQHKRVWSSVWINTALAMRLRLGWLVPFWYPLEALGRSAWCWWIAGNFRFARNLPKACEVVRIVFPSPLRFGFDQQSFLPGRLAWRWCEVMVLWTSDE